jgi:hypothetical protein
MRISRPLTIAASAAMLALPGTALAADYPPASDPGKGPRTAPGGGTLKVCKKGCKYKKIQKAIDAAGKGTKIRVGKGTYKEGLKVLSPAHDRVQIIGDPKKPGNVVLEGKGLKGSPAQNGIQINNADGVVVNGITARHYKGNGFFVANADGYKFTNLVADTTGVYGVYAFNSKGGEISRSEAFYNNDAGYYVGQTPPQTRPKRTTIKNVVAWGNVLGYSGTNSRYVTITKSKFFNNGVGIVPNVLDSEKFMPHEDNAIVDNDIFWNNFNYYDKAPFQVREGAEGLLYPVGTGILLFGGRTAKVENNRIYGHYLVGYGQISQFLLDDKDKPLGLLEGNEVRGNAFGLGGEDLNGRDLFYDGSGSSNCFENNTLTAGRNTPADNSTFSACGQPNSFNEGARNEAFGWVADSTHEANWIKSPHKPIEGITPLEHWTAAYPHPEAK